MSWTIQVDATGAMKAAGATEQAGMPSKGGAWSYTPTADKTPPAPNGSTQQWRTWEVGQHVLSALVGFD